MSQYATLDKLIVDVLRHGPHLLYFLFDYSVREECTRIASATGREPYRVIDGRLQALRKAGVIVFNSKTGWMLK